MIHLPQRSTLSQESNWLGESQENAGCFLLMRGFVNFLAPASALADSTLAPAALLQSVPKAQHQG